MNNTYEFIVNFQTQRKRLEETKMADLNLELAMKIIPIFNGSYKNLSHFLKCIELMYKTLKPEAKIELIDFVFNIKLNSNNSGRTFIIFYVRHIFI